MIDDTVSVLAPVLLIVCCVVVDIEPLRALKRRVTLAELKQSALFADSPLVRQGRLSVVPLTPAQWAAIETGAGL